MRWIKKGLIFKAGGEYGWINSHAQVPKVLVRDDCLRVYFSPRPVPRKSCIAMMDLDIDNPSHIIQIYDKPVLEHGEKGQFDEHGVMPQWVGEVDGKVYLLYAGWSRRDSIPYSNWVGIACSEDGGLSFTKMFKGPVLDRTPDETLSGTGLVCIKNGDIYYGFYANGTKWYERENGWDSAYEIVSAKSKDLIHWYDRNGIPLLPARIKNEANTAPTVVKIGNRFHMWFCYRGVEDYHDGEQSYSIGYAWSDDLEHWNRDDSKAGIEKSKNGFDSKMMAYPYVVKVKDKYLMFYNGNGFGQGGFGYAELEDFEMINSDIVKNWRDPDTKETLVLKENGALASQSGKEYEVNNGIPNLIKLTDKEKNQYAINLFAKESGEYDDYHHLTYKLFKSNEDDVRNSIIDKLCIDGKKGIKVLELSAGTGRDSVLIKKRMSEESELHVQDISLDMLKVLKNKFEDGEVIITQSNAEALPYPDNFFDAIYSYGGVGMSLYSDVKAQMNEIIRVTKPGAKVVIAGRGLAPWLYNTEFGRILIDYNKHYMNKFSLEDIPVEARNVNLSWILHGVVYCMEFDVGEGEPDADFDFDIPGVRGGTLRTRYYGKLEGVSPETKKLAQEAREKLDVSMYDFLNQAIQKAARDILGGGITDKRYCGNPVLKGMKYYDAGKQVA